MKNKTILFGLVSVLLPLWCSTIAAQSLGDVARQTRAKRGKQTKPPARVLTNEDFPEPPPAEEPKASAAESGTPAGEASEAAGPSEKPSGEAAAPGEAKEAKPEDKMKTREYWQGQFKAARQKVADAEEVQRLSEDELSLLQIQHARELSPDAQSELQGRMQAKQAELDAKRTDTAKAQKALEDLEKEFKESGAPEDWSKTE